MRPSRSSVIAITSAVSNRSSTARCPSCSIPPPPTEPSSQVPRGAAILLPVPEVPAGGGDPADPHLQRAGAGRPRQAGGQRAARGGGHGPLGDPTAVAEQRDREASGLRCAERDDHGPLLEQAQARTFPHTGGGRDPDRLLRAPTTRRIPAARRWRGRRRGRRLARTRSAFRRATTSAGCRRHRSVLVDRRGRRRVVEDDRPHPGGGVSPGLTATSAPSGEKAGLNTSLPASRASWRSHAKPAFETSRHRPSGNGATPDGLGPHQPVAEPARVDHRARGRLARAASRVPSRTGTARSRRSRGCRAGCRPARARSRAAARPSPRSARWGRSRRSPQSRRAAARRRSAGPCGRGRTRTCCGRPPAAIRPTLPTATCACLRA